MKKSIFLLPLLTGLLAAAQGYEIKVTLKPYKNQYVYLGHHYGKQLPIIDSVMLNDKSEAVFKGAKKLPGGIYLIGFPGKTGYFEVLIDKQQQFSVVADTANLKKNITFTNSSDNTLFSSYQAFMSEKGMTLDNAYKSRAASKTAQDSAKWKAVIDATNKEVQTFRKDLMDKNPNAMITFLFKAMRDPEIPPAAQHPGGKYDSSFVFNYYKSHFWDDVYFFDERLVRTPFFENKLDQYFEQLVYPNPDSVKKELDWMLGYASASPEMTKYLLLKFANRYLNQKYMWEDAVFVHLFEKYFAQKNYEWLNEKGKKTITDRAYSLMANIMGSAAADIDLPDTTGKHKSLYSVDAAYTVVVIWDPTCGHCKEVLPKLDTMYKTKWKAMGMKLFALAKETEGTQADWKNFIRDYNLKDWIHVYYSKADEKIRVDAGIPSYSQLYDVLSFPTLFLLDKDKRIIAKKLSFEQIDEVLKHKTAKN